MIIIRAESHGRTQMTKHERPMTKEARSTNDEEAFSQPGHPDIRHSFDLRHSVFVIFRRETELQGAAVSRSYRPAVALPIAGACAPHLLDRGVLPASHAESPPVAVPAVGQGGLCESVRPGSPCESQERIVSFGKSEDSRLPCCSQISPHSCRLRCRSSEFRRFP